MAEDHNVQRGGNSGPWWVVVAAFLGISFPFSAGVKAPGTASREAEGKEQGKTEAAAKPKAKGEGDRAPQEEEQQSLIGEHKAGGLLVQFLGADKDGNLSLPKDDPRRDARLEFLIATVPDPVDSRFDYLFDLQVEAIQRALESAGYSLDRFHLPWLRDHAGDGGDHPTVQNLTEEPGILLFRRAEKAAPLEVLVLFLVGETPTSGIQKAAFKSALDHIAGFSPSDQAGKERLAKTALRFFTVPNNEIRILGPTFSGSALSLEFGIRSWLADSKSVGHTFELVSGSATAISPDKNGEYSIGGAKFQATVIPDSAAIECFFKYLGDQGVARNEVALLVEANTAYGQNRTRDLLRVPFPLHIASLRKETETSKSSHPTGDAMSPLVRAPETALQLTDSHPTKETPPAISRLHTSSLEPMLDSLLSTLSQQQVKYVGILASDVRDLLFLAREVRETCPNTVLFTLTNDVLYLHAQANSSLLGMLVLTSYPLSAGNDAGCPPVFNNTLLQFSNDLAQGAYNAALALLERSDLMLEYDPRGGGAEGSWSRGPSLWITAVGRGGFWPIRVLDGVKAQAAYPKYVYEAPLCPAITEYSSSLPFVGPICWSLGCLALCFFLLRPFLHFRSTMSFAPQGDARPIHFKRQVYLFASVASLASFHLLTCCAWSLPLITNGSGTVVGWEEALTGIVLVSAMVLLLGLVALFLRRAWSARHALPRGRWWVSIIFVLAGCGLGAALTSWQGVSWLTLNSKARMVLHARLAAVTNGLSPLAPLFFMAMASFACTYCVLRRLRLLDENPTKDSPLHFAVPSFAGLMTIERRLGKFLRCEVAELPGAVWLIILLAFPCLALFFGPFAPPLEEPPFKWFFRISFFTIYLGLAMEFLRFVFLWRTLKKLLLKFALHPLGTAFLDLPKSQPMLPKVQISSAPHPITMAQLSLDHACRVVKSVAELQTLPSTAGGFEKHLDLHRAELKTLFRAAKTCLSKAFNEEALRRFDAALTWRRKARLQLASFAAIVATALERHWWDLGGRETPKGDAPKPPETRPSPNESGRDLPQAAERFLASHLASYLQLVLAQLQNLISFVTAGLLLMLLAVASYPFQPKSWLMLFNWSIVLTVVMVTLLVFVQMNRDHILSALSGTEPGRLNWDRNFILRIVLFGALPIFGLLGAQFPDELRRLGSWLTTILSGGK